MKNVKNHIKYIYWFTYYNENSPSVRYRAKYPLEFFKREYDIESCLVIPGYQPKRLFKFIKYYFSALFFRKKNSLIVIQRVHSNFIYSTLLIFLITVRRSYSVYDLDDADYLYCPPKTIHSFAKKCDILTPGSTKIAEYLSKFNKNIVITSSPTPDLQIQKTNKNKKFTIGWIGGFGGDHKKGLIELVFPAIQNLNINVKFTILGVTKRKDNELIYKIFAKHKNIELDIPTDINWRNEVEIQKRIALFDVGIATLIPTEIQLSKSGIKVKQYLNNGIPVLSSNLGENSPFIKHGYNGYLCENINEFQHRIIEFFGMDNESYMKISKNARDSIFNFNIQKYYEDFITVETKRSKIRKN